MYTLIIAALFLLTTFSAGICAQVTDSAAAKTEDSAPQTFPVIPIAFSTNETGAAIGVMYNQVLSNGSKDRPDNLQAYAYYSSKGLYSLSLKPSFFLNEGDYHFTGAVFTAYSPSTFWGVGKEAGDSDRDEDFTSKTRGFTVAGTARIDGPYRVGMSLSYNHEKFSDVEPGGLLARGTLEGSAGGEDVGFGLLTEMDSRDSTFWPTTGSFCKLNAVVHRNAVGSDYNYNEYNLDLRTYRLLSTDSLVALRIITSGTGGAPPLYALRQLGGSRLLRGLYGGRYRDRWLYAAQTEYRAHLTGRFSWTTFAALGNVAEQPEELFDDTPLLTGGCGIRFAVDPENRVNLRVDIGLSRHGVAPMVMINEAF
ncbi:MAG: BamA/TamA family outer membrane protein [Desulfuromonadaceae bacterium]|nr:BamA/TamA family outer membrane protein [Desulfuromonadaceae bacterium]